MGTSVKNRRKRIKAVKAGGGQLWVTITALVAIVAAGLIGWGIYETQRPTTYATPAGANPSGDGLVLGDGPVTVDLYVDLQCPICQNFEGTAGATLNQLVADHTIKIVYHPIAILDDRSTTGYSTRAGAAVAASGGTGKLADYLTALYKAQPAEGSAGLTNAELIRIAGTVGITDQSFADAVDSGQYRSWVTHVTEVADGKGIRATPTVLVNGQPVDAQLDAVQAAINAVAA